MRLILLSSFYSPITLLSCMKKSGVGLGVEVGGGDR